MGSNKDTVIVVNVVMSAREREALRDLTEKRGYGDPVALLRDMIKEACEQEGIHYPAAHDEE